MQFTPTLIGEAATLARTHGEMLAHLPATVHASILVELQKWADAVQPEQRYQRALLEHLSRLPKSSLDSATSGIARIEVQAGIAKVTDRHPAGFQDAAQALLRQRGLQVAWRSEVDGFFRAIDPALEARLYPADAPRRLVVQIYGSGIAVQRDKLWSRFKGAGVRVPLDLDATGAPNSSSGSCSARRMVTARPPCSTRPPHRLRSTRGSSNRTKRCTASATPRRRRRGAGGGATGLSYDRLRQYRDDLTRALNSKIQSGVESPQAFAAYARSLQIAPPAGALLYSADVLIAFVRDVLLTGNGTLLMNNTFVEWAAVQALKRAQPRILITRFGVRDKLRPFSSMVMFSQPRPSDQLPSVQDPAGSFVDVEQLSYYIWLNAEKTPAYRGKTLYLFLAEGVDEMLAIRSDRPAATAAGLPPARLSDVYATMAQWLGVPLAGHAGQSIEAIISGT